MNSSPGTPTGTGRRPGSSRWMRVLAIGRPIGTPPLSSGPQIQEVTSTAASVGP
jgi:hypothetical protein